MTGEGLPPVILERSGGVAVISLNRPRARNAINTALAAALYEAIAACKDARAVVLTGADPAFCAGLDLQQLREEGIPRLGLAAAIRAMHCPVIAAVNGPCVTGGLELAVACDFIVASERAVFADSHVRLGVYPGGGLTARLPLFVGPAFATYLSLCGSGVDATAALRAGLAVEVTRHAELLPAATGLARRICEYDPIVVRQLRAAYAAAPFRPEAESWAEEDTLADQLHARASHAQLQRSIDRLRAR